MGREWGPLCLTDLSLGIPSGEEVDGGGEDAWDRKEERVEHQHHHLLNQPVEQLERLPHNTPTSRVSQAGPCCDLLGQKARRGLLYL